jgi:hypothetical protein
MAAAVPARSLSDIGGPGYPIREIQEHPVDV